MRVKNDEGATAVLVAIFVAFVMLPALALSVDVGNMYSEKRRLQNSADSAAMAVALSCAKTSCTTSEAQTYADKNQKYADKNNSSGVDVKYVCGTALGISCPPAGPGCEAAAPTGKYVQVGVTPKGGEWTPIILPDSKKDVPACARASTGGVGKCSISAVASCIPVTLSACEWDAATSGGTNYAPKGPYDPFPAPVFPAVTYERVIKLHTTAGVPTCGAGPSGADVPGGFGWLDSDTSCNADDTHHDGSVGVGDVFSGDPGAGLPTPCKSVLEDYWTTKQVLYLPVFDKVTGTGTGSEYHIKGFAAFVLTGYNLPGGKQTSWLSNKELCKGSDKCLYGFFTQALIPGKGMSGGGPSMGANTVGMVL